ncbi:TrmH family RNA methyltransferase [Jiangella rhizosphaerae]|uniref:RNA methyltransferase n=1 Tax=Jiangella rhizosphaerae TaxID=2293569 RepID=A0A418KU02_9ACTN|nr:TrmH family RNA methyltransferase [Jiangella rhizosphaerae]RIQ31029.1 RNA methyltransferase [Jiangella rhizosphaerae]
MKAVERRNATFQQWQALLTNRSKRQSSGRLLVQGVRPISLAAAAGVPFVSLLFDGRPRPSSWAAELMASGLAPVVRVAPELLAELGERADGAPELLAVVEHPGDDDVARLPSAADALVVVFDRPVSPGNVGSLVRSADALGAHAVVVTGHAADPWDPQAVRASTGSIFTIPVLRLPGPGPVLEWAAGRAPVIGTDESGTVDLADAPLAGPAVVVIGNETAGMSRAWRDGCDIVARIPMTGGASSLNAAAAGAVVLYEALRQRSARPSS